MISCKKGFTLIELMVVIAIITILLAGTGISYMKHLPDYRLNKAAQELYLDFHLAKSQAVLNTEIVQVEFDTDKGTYDIRTLGSDGAVGGVGPAQDRVIKHVCLADFKSGVRFGNGSATSTIPGGSFNGKFVSYTGANAKFIPNGIVNTKGYVYLTNDRNTLCYGVGTPSLSGVIRKKKTTNGVWIDG